MTDRKEPFDRSSAERLLNSLDDIDTEIARLALLCQVRILDPGVIDRVVRNDASVCGTTNRVAFQKLHHMIALHFGVLGSASAAHGQAQASRVEQQVIERLRARFPELAGDWPGAPR